MYKKEGTWHKFLGLVLNPKRILKYIKMLKECSKIMKEIFSYLSNVSLPSINRTLSHPVILELIESTRHHTKSSQKESALVLNVIEGRKKVKLFTCILILISC